METKLIIFIISLALMITDIKAEINCHKPLPQIVSNATETCCSLPNFYTAEIKEKCGSNENEFKRDIGRDHQCFVSCALDHIGILTDGKLEEDILNSYLNTALEDTPDIIDIIMQAFKVCIPNYETVGKMIKTKTPCALYHLLIMDCVFTKTFKNCTNTIWSDTDECNEIREHWITCLPDTI